MMIWLEIRYKKLLVSESLFFWLLLQIHLLLISRIDISNCICHLYLLTFSYYGAEGGVLELLRTGAPYAPHVKAKIT